jgi:uncharacterized caspase-like protein
MERVKKTLLLVISFLIPVLMHSETYVVCVGISNYKDTNVQNLVQPETDAKAMAEFYKKITKNVILITGKYATKSKILKCAKSQFSHAKSGDKIVFYFSGHGYPGGFCPYDIRDISSGLQYYEIENIMKQSKASSKFIFADACNSGAIRQSNNNGRRQSNNDILFFLSSRGNESSLESPYVVNGFFTKYLLRGLRGAADSNNDLKITAKELFNFVSSSVIDKSKKQQHPVMWGNFSNSLVIVQYVK